MTTNPEWKECYEWDYEKGAFVYRIRTPENEVAATCQSKGMARKIIKKLNDTGNKWP